MKYILYWTPMLSSPIWYFSGSGSSIFASCEYSNCFATTNRTLLPVENFSAIMFYTPRKRPQTLPKKRSPNQRYVFANNESPLNFPIDRNSYLIEDFYNWTMSYRDDSDVKRPHGWIVKDDKEYVPPNVEKKRKLVAWFVSHCKTFNGREIIAKKLGKYVKVDVYGACGELRCRNRPDCYKMLERDYYFYLSFENSHCNDYVTEKLYNILKLNVVPVVYGQVDYKKLAPPNSVINVADFDTVKNLAEYLLTLSRNETAYLEYFEWKKEYRVETSTKRIACELCRKLNDPTEPKKTYKDIKQWWFGHSNAKCTMGKYLPKILFSS